MHKGENKVVGLRWEDDCLSNHLALGVHRNFYGICASARRSTNEGVVVRRGPASVTDISRRYLACISVGGGSSQHSEALEQVN
jgi:hypothetical protein